MSPRQAQRHHGFTLIELILVITILGVISVSVAQVISLSANGRKIYRKKNQRKGG